MGLFGPSKKEIEVKPWIMDLIKESNGTLAGVHAYINSKSDHLRGVGNYDTSYVRGHRRELSEARRIVDETRQALAAGKRVTFVSRG